MDTLMLVLITVIVVSGALIGSTIKPTLNNILRLFVGVILMAFAGMLLGALTDVGDFLRNLPVIRG